VGALLEFEDITEAEAEEQRRQLRERFAELGEMTAGVAHQLKNGLAVLKGHAQLLIRNGHEQTGRELLEETDGLERVVQGFLQWARPLEPQCREVDLREVASAVLDEARRRPAARGIQLVLEGQGRAVADPLLLHQALVNLVENGCHASPAGGTVRILLEDLMIRVLDEGHGIAPDRVQRMFRPFESGRPEGTGLGLPLALKWINAQGADLSLGARPEGGTCAELRWPH
jgi:signal transduction histidine kinase